MTNSAVTRTKVGLSFLAVATLTLLANASYKRRESNTDWSLELEAEALTKELSNANNYREISQELARQLQKLDSSIKRGEDIDLESIGQIRNTIDVLHASHTIGRICSCPELLAPVK